MTPPLAGIVLAGGAARRLAGVDKPMLEVGGMPLLLRAVAALHGADDVVVVGPRREGVPGVRWTREDPPGSGPVAALAAGLDLVTADVVAVLAADLSAVTSRTIGRLRSALGDADGAVLVDDEGRRQWLLGVWRTSALRAALPADPAGASLRRTLGGLSIVDVPALPGEAADVDTPEDLPGG
ncbi:molybdenum cofactor guanylyltransferase [Prauserella flavalba]|uniref:molybdenum cofactor guanylyltransferase n=1 Tax=Prauserella flavalba TaxID=1477506 RepID=UPI0036E17CE9